jgi:hypothetical protein
MKKFLSSTTIAILIASTISAQAEEVKPPIEIEAEKSTIQESNFYSLALDVYSIPEAKSLITAVAGKKIFIGDRASRVIHQGQVIDKKIVLNGTVSVPAPTIAGHASNALLDMVTSSKYLFLAVVDGATYEFPSCGAAKIYQYSLANLKAKPKRIFVSSPCVMGELFWDARLALRDNTVIIAGGNSLVKYDDGTFPGPDSQDFVDGMPFPKTNYFGAVTSINLSTLKTTVIATGLRHLGGLLWDQERKALWETENGPRGGDELNIILAGKNYGWPQVTLGRPYDFETPKKSGVKPNSVGSSEAPVYGWTPSISPSTVRKTPKTGEFSKYWATDLIVGSLKGNQLRRLRISAKNTVMYDEPIQIGDRIRTLDFLSDGRLILATDTGRIVLISDAKNPLRGRFPVDPPPAG